MNIRINTLIILIISIFSLQINAQEFVKGLKSPQLKNYGLNSERTGDYISAAHYFDEYLKKEPQDFDIVYKLANCLLATNNYEAAETQFAICFDNQPEKFPLAQFYLAKMQRKSGKYDEAVTNLTNFKKSYKDVVDWESIKKEYANEINSCLYAPRLIDSVCNVEINPLEGDINKFQADFAPYLLDSNTLIYTSLRSDDYVEYEPEENEVIPSKKLYTAKKVNGKWTFNGEFEGPFNQAGINVGNGVLSADGKRFFFTQCIKNWQFITICSIYMSSKENGIWQIPVKLGSDINGENFSSTQPTIGIQSESGNEVLYFSSNREGGKGNFDIWYSVYNPKTELYKDAKNAGSTINTTGDEITPFYDIENRTLFFSSDGLPGLGGMDVFRTEGELREWSTPRNVGVPVNSNVDDIYYTYGKNPGNGFLVSNRKTKLSHSESSCCYDILNFKNIEYKYIVMSGTVFETIIDTDEKINQNKTPIKEAVVSLYKKDIATDKFVLIKNDTTDTKGTYNFNLQTDSQYQIIALKDSFIVNNYTFSTDKVIKSEKFKTDLGLVKKEMKSVRILNIYYDQNQSDLSESAKQTIDTTLLLLMKKFPEIIVEISSHTDNTGSAKTNLQLSENRATGVVDYLVEHGIEKNRLQSKGYGEKQPLEPNTTSDGKDNPEGRKKNRRTEFKVIGTLSKDTKIIYE